MTKKRLRGSAIEPAARRAIASARQLRSAPQIAREALARAIAAAARAPRDAARGRAYRRALLEALPFQIVGEPADGDLAIVVCLWNRPERLGTILDLIDSQVTARRLHLVLWNNDYRRGAEYDAVVQAHPRGGALTSIRLHHARENIGGIGRFVAIRALVAEGYSGPFIMLDDDQDVSTHFVEDLVRAWAPHSIVGVWAWLTNTEYWDRGRVMFEHEPVNHVGTGGAIVDADLVSHDSFFRWLPSRFLFLEDMWMSRCALRNGWRLAYVDSPFEFVMSDRDQGHALVDEKAAFYRWLAKARRMPSWG